MVSLGFFKFYWDIIKDDVIVVILRMDNQGGALMGLINSANIILLPKHLDAERVVDYRPIILIHSMSKLFSKFLANGLAPVLHTLISKSQSAFIIKHCIHENFLYAQNLIKELHKSNTPSLFIKLDISKAFDSVNWAYLLEVMQHLSQQVAI
ncbi:hypothetical protein ACQ4PT_070717 [Festuca glaucescens]